MTTGRTTPTSSIADNRHHNLQLSTIPLHWRIGEPNGLSRDPRYILLLVQSWLSVGTRRSFVPPQFIFPGMATIRLAKAPHGFYSKIGTNGRVQSRVYGIRVQTHDVFCFARVNEWTNKDGDYSTDCGVFLQPTNKNCY